MIRSVFVLVPALAPTGPVKGAIALANALAARVDVTLAALKPGPGADARIAPGVRTLELPAVARGARGRVAAYRAMLRERGGRPCVASLSMCFSADFANSFCGSDARTFASVRGNLVQNYRFDYGLPGVPLAIAHLAALRRFDRAVAMSDAMARQVKFYAGARPAVIPNFVDEGALDAYRCSEHATGPLRFVFVASLSRRKQPGLVVAALHALRSRGVDAVLDLVGDGPLRAQIAGDVERLGLTGAVTLHGHLADPYPVVARADAMVLPSLSEGTSRAALESLYLGVPCVLRHADGNAELIETGRNGVVFADDRELPDAMHAAAALSRGHGEPREPLLPQRYRQQSAALAYLDLFENAA